MVSTKILKPVTDWSDYAKTAQWCNENNARIVERDDCYEVVILPSPTFDEQKTQKKHDIAAARYAAETAGIIVNGILIDTERDSQTLITGAALAAVIDSSYSLNWKTESKFIHLTAPEIITVAQAVRAHVQACFDREAELCALVDAAETPEDLDEIIISWPV